MENCVICGKPRVMFRESGYVCEYHGSMCDRGYDLADIVEEEKNDAEVAAMQAFEKSIGWGEATEPTAAAQGEDTPELYQPKADLNADNLEYWPKMFRERVEWKDYYNEHAKNDMMDALDVIATLQAALQQAQRERDAALAALERIATTPDRVEQVSKVWVFGKPLHEQMQEYAAKVLAASAQQAAQPADGEG